jgi:hypothetical protein
MNMSAFDKALEKGYSLLVFHERYGGGWTAIIGPDADSLAFIENELTASGDTGAVEMQGYLCSAGKYFPVSRNKQSSPTAALADLQTILETVPAEYWPTWYNKVLAAFDAMQEATRKYQHGDYWIAQARDAGELVLVE